MKMAEYMSMAIVTVTLKRFFYSMKKPEAGHH